MKKLFLLISVLVILLLSCTVVSALEEPMTDTYLVSSADGYTFETVINPTATADCIPIITMYNSQGAMCGLMYGDTISITKGVISVKTYTVDATEAPASAKFMLWKTDGSFVPLSDYEQISLNLYSEKYGMIVEADTSAGIKLFTSDGVNATYDFDDDFVLSYGNKTISDRTVAYDYLDTLKLKSYKRVADIDSDGDGKKDTWTPQYDWILSFSNEERYSKGVAASTKYPHLNNSDYLYGYEDFLKNYSARMIRVLVSPEGKIASMAFADDKLFGKLNSEKTYNEAFYNLSIQSFNDSFNISDKTKILYLPTKSGIDKDQYTLLTAAELANGNLYHLKDFITSSGEHIVLITYMATDDEISEINKKPIENITVALNGNGTSTIVGIKEYKFAINVNKQSPDDNDAANKAANNSMSYVAQGLEGALEGASEGYAITKNYVKIKFKNEIDAAKAQLNIIKGLDEKLGLTSPSYYNNFENAIPNAIGNAATTFLYEYFIGSL